MKSEAILYVPSDTPESMVMATMKVAGVPLIVRGIMTLFAAGIDDVTLLIALSQREKIERFLKRYRSERLPKIEIVTYDEPYRVSPSVVDALQRGAGSQLFLINSNLLFDDELIKAMHAFSVRGREVLICAEGTHHVPIMRITKTSLASLSSFVNAGSRSIESCIRLLTDESHLEVIQKPASSNTFLVRRPRERVLAEKFLAETIRLATNGPIAKYINKRFSLPVSVFLSKLWINPHAITSINIIIGLLSGVFMAGKGYMSLLIGGTLFQLASVSDGIDGEISKLTFRSSKFGQFIDTISDNLALASCLVGLTIGAARVFSPIVAFAAGAFAILNTVFIISVMVSYLKKNTNSASLATFNKVYLERLPTSVPSWIRWFIGHFKFFIMKDCFAFMIFVFGLFGILPVYLFFIDLGAVLATVSLGYLQLGSRIVKLEKIYETAAEEKSNCI